MTPGLVLVPISNDNYLVSDNTYFPADVAADGSVVANRLAAIVDADADGDMDIVFTKAEKYFIEGWCTWSLAIARNNGDSSAGQCAELSSDMQTHDDICKAL